jgi:hypothetical protein
VAATLPPPSLMSYTPHRHVCQALPLHPRQPISSAKLLISTTFATPPCHALTFPWYFFFFLIAFVLRFPNFSSRVNKFTPLSPCEWKGLHPQPTLSLTSFPLTMLIFISFPAESAFPVELAALVPVIFRVSFIFPSNLLCFRL